MKGIIGLRKPIASYYLDAAVTSITSSAYVALNSSPYNTYAASAVQVTNQSTQPITLAIGASGSQVTTNIMIPPTNNSDNILPVEIPAKSALWLKTQSATISSGMITCTLFG